MIPTGSAPTATDAAQRRTQAQRTVDEFVAAARRGDRAAATALVSSRDQAFADLAGVWITNLQRIPWSQLSWTVESSQVPLPAARRQLLGDSAWVQQVSLTWALPGERRAASERLWLTFVEEPTDEGSGAGGSGAGGSGAGGSGAGGPGAGGPGAGGSGAGSGAGGSGAGGVVARLAGDGDSPTVAPVPIWLQQRVTLLQSGSVRVLTDAEDGAQWLSQARAAYRAVAARVGPADRDRGGVLVVEVPQSRAVFERALGVAAGSYAAVAAAAWPMGRDSASAPVHVVVNPEASRQLSVLGRDVLLTHEAVHAATRSPGSPAPTWLVEGYADQIAYDAYPAGRVPAEKTVRQYVREHQAPTAWPTDGDFAADASDLDLSYDLAWTAVRSIADAYGDDGLNEFYAALERDGSVADAAQTIGTTERALRQRWRSDLEVLAGR